MTYKIKNISGDSRQFRIHKTVEAFFLRPGEEVIVPYLPIQDRSDIFQVTEINEKKNEEEESEKPRKRDKVVRRTEE